MFISFVVVGCLFLVHVAPTTADPTGTRCPTVSGVTDTCVCKSDKGIIDLRYIAQKNGPRFAGLQDINNYLYDYNPCQTFSGDIGCEDVHICQISSGDPPLSYDIADKGTEQMWIDTDGTPYLFYTGPGGRETKVFLVCDPTAATPSASTTGDSKLILHYEFHVTAKEVCAGYSPSSGGGGVAPGEIGLVIIFVIIPLGIATYIVVGILVMIFRYQATGTDIIPNKGFWLSFPFLVKDGCLFTISPITKAVQKDQYQPVGKS